MICRRHIIYAMPPLMLLRFRHTIAFSPLLITPLFDAAYIRRFERFRR